MPVYGPFIASISPYFASSYSKRSWDTTMSSTRPGIVEPAGIAAAVSKIFGDRVEPALGGGAWQQRGGRIFAVLFVAGGDVGAELVFDELIEDLGHQP